MPRVSILMGQGGADPGTGAAIWRFYEGATDAGTPFDVLAESVWVPAQPGHSDYLFRAVYLTVTWTMTAELVVSAQIDADPEPDAVNGWTFEQLGPVLTLTGSGSRQTQTFEFPLLMKMVRGGLELSRNGLRGRRARVRVASTSGLAVGALVIEGVGIDMEQLEESIAQQGAP